MKRAVESEREEMVWWVDLNYPPFEEGKGGFPRTGQVVRHYREKKREDDGKALSQRGLAQFLDITEKAVRDIENRDAGLDLDRRQLLCQLLDIPPILLGIRIREEILKIVEQQRAKKAASVVSPSVTPPTLWWIELGYPSFAPGKDVFFPRTGQVIKHYRGLKMDILGKPWTQRRLAQALNIETDQAVWNLENRDTALDFNRRQFLCRLFDIPPILFGIISLEEIDKLVEQRKIAKTANSVISTKKILIDIEEYTALLASYWATYVSNPTQISITNIFLCIEALYRELPLTRKKKTIQELLCRFHGLAANLLVDRHEYDNALIHLEKALQFAQLLNKDELKVLVLYDYGYALKVAGHIDKALEKYEEGRCYERCLPSNLRGSLLLETGGTAAQTAKTPNQKDAAIALIDRVGNMVRSKETGEDPYFLNFNLDHYHLTRSESLIAVGRNRDAIQELRLVEAGPEYPRRQAYNNILQAQAQLNLGEYSEAACLAASGLVIVQGVNSAKNIARVKRICKQFPRSLFKHDADVARLEYLLSKR